MAAPQNTASTPTTETSSSPDLPPNPPALERQSAVAVSTSTEPKEEKKPAPKRKRSSKRSYTVHVPYGSEGKFQEIHTHKSGPRAAVSHGVRRMIKDIPLKMDTTVHVKSQKKKYQFTVKRDYDNPKHRRFLVTKVTGV